MATGEVMGNGAIKISITVYPNCDGGKRYDQCITRSLSIDYMETLREMERVAYNMGELVTNTIVAMSDTLRGREDDAAKAAYQAVQAEEPECVVIEEELPE